MQTIMESALPAKSFIISSFASTFYPLWMELGTLCVFITVGDMVICRGRVDCVEDLLDWNVIAWWMRRMWSGRSAYHEFTALPWFPDEMRADIEALYYEKMLESALFFSAMMGMGLAWTMWLRMRTSWTARER